MSVPKMMFVTAVPFGLARFQSNVSKTVLNIAESCRIVDNDMRILPRLKSPLKRTSTTNSRMLKKRNKIFHNRQSTHASSEKIKLQKDFLDQMLLDINMEKMRLFLENEDLKLKCSSLEEENHSLQLQLQASQSSQNKKSQMCEETFKYASLVSIPQPKDWVLPQIFTILMIALAEVLNNFQLKPLIAFPLLKMYYISSSWIKSVMPQTGMMKQMCLSPLYHKT
ncbi:hypothetical protein CDAR_365281 [Caerostris darwini]|uniref:Uncharacterized protein n=1 Tax=Caerostris darwini TaxID=1538125 RepID=A0AAV4U8I2_9ARAC|nr:hypothetical protein CDAR_365281 [Caerostris darwini]